MSMSISAIAREKPALCNIVPPTTPLNRVPTYAEKYTLSPTESNTSPATTTESSIFSRESDPSSRDTTLSSFGSYSAMSNYRSAHTLSFDDARSRQVSADSILHFNPSTLIDERDTAWPAANSPDKSCAGRTPNLDCFYGRPQRVIQSPVSAMTPSQIQYVNPYRAI
jgi:hypothetical protein